MRTSNSKPGNLSAGDGSGQESFDSAAAGNETSSSAPFADFAYENDVYGKGDSPVVSAPPVGTGNGIKGSGSKVPRSSSKKLYKRKRPSKSGGHGL